MIRFRGVPISNDEASRLARELRAHGGASVAVAERIERALALGTGIIGADRVQARAVLAVIESWDDEDGRLPEIRGQLRRFGDTK